MTQWAWRSESGVAGRYPVFRSWRYEVAIEPLAKARRFPEIRIASIPAAMKALDRLDVDIKSAEAIRGR
jgi:hypothetical protein